MKRLIQIIAAGALAVGGLNASTITTPSEAAGTVGTYNISTFDATANTMGGLKVIVTWSDGTTRNCTWSNASGGCSVNNFFSISENDGSLDTYNGTWSLSNNWNPTGPNPTITSVQLIGSGVENATGLVGFDICWNSPSTQNWSNAGASGGNGGTCGDTGTAGTDIGWSASSVSGGKGISTASVTYTDRVRLPGGPANGVGDEFSKVTLNFGSGVFTTNGGAFTWRMDTDLLMAAPVPEPATYGLVGLALLGFGALNSRRKRS